MTDSNGTSDGRDTRGRFTRGNAGGPGNPHLSTLNRHRAAMLSGVKDKDIRRAMRVMIEVMNDEKARDADRLTAARMLLDRVLGTPAQADVEERIAALERLIQEQANVRRN